MKNIVLIVLLTVTLFSWETTTHRAIDRKAIESSANLSKFIENSKIDTEYKFINEKFEGYGLSYKSYIKEGEEGGISDWNQTFSGDNNIQDIIEAGTILEDAQWTHAFHPGDGRFNNHFYDPQAGGKGLDIGVAQFQNAMQWAQTGDPADTSYTVGPFSRHDNMYSLDLALDYFELGFTLPQQNERRRYQAKMLVSVGHIMHLMNDMDVPAHTRNDAHPKGDSLEWWARSGENGDKPMGFYVKGSTVQNYAEFYPEKPYQYSDFLSHMREEARFTGTHFFSGYAKYTWDLMDTIEKKSTPRQLSQL